LTRAVLAIEAKGYGPATVKNIRTMSAWVEAFFRKIPKKKANSRALEIQGRLGYFPQRKEEIEGQLQGLSP
jgi:hypothetical protein